MRGKISKKLTLIVAFGVILVLVVVSTALAQGPSGSGWWSGFTIQNATSDTNTVLVKAYHLTDSTNNNIYASPATNVPGGGAVTFHPGFPGTCSGDPVQNGCRIALVPDLPAGFEGSSVVESTAAAVAFAALSNNPSGSVGVDGGKARAAYQGTGQPSDKLFFPSFKVNFAGQSSILYVQAAGSEATVTVTYTTQETTPKVYEETKTIRENRTYAFVPAAAGVPSCGGSSENHCRGGAIATSSSGNIAGTLVEYEEGVPIAEFVLTARALTPDDVGPVVVVPSLKNEYFSGTTGAPILNTTATEATVDLKFLVTGLESAGCAGAGIVIGTERTGTVTVPPEGTVVISRFQGNTELPDCTFYSMTATDRGQDQDLAITVNQTQVQNGQNLKSKYTGFNTAIATSDVLFPLVKENFVDNTSGVTLVNSSSVETKVVCTYSGSAGVSILETKSLTAGQAVTLRTTYIANPSRFVPIGGTSLPVEGNKYAVSCTSQAANSTLVGMSQESTLSGTRLDLKNYEGFSQ